MTRTKKPRAVASTPDGAPCRHPARCTPGAPQCDPCLDRAYRLREASIERGKAAPTVAAVCEPRQPPRLKPAPPRLAPLPFDGAHPAAQATTVRLLAIFDAMTTEDPVRRRAMLERAPATPRVRRDARGVRHTTFADEAMALIAASPPNMPRLLDEAIVRVKDEMGEARGSEFLREKWCADMVRGIWTGKIARYIGGLIRDHFRPGRFALTEEGWRRFVEGAHAWRACCIWIKHLSASGLGWREVGSGRRMAIALQTPLMSDAQIAGAVRAVDPARTERTAEWSVYDAITELRRDDWGIERRAKTGRPPKPGKP